MLGGFIIHPLEMMRALNISNDRKTEINEKFDKLDPDLKDKVIDINKRAAEASRVLRKCTKEYHALEDSLNNEDMKIVCDFLDIAYCEALFPDKKEVDEDATST